jgi:hypothetical protein
VGEPLGDSAVLRCSTLSERATTQSATVTSISVGSTTAGAGTPHSGWCRGFRRRTDERVCEIGASEDAAQLDDVSALQRLLSVSTTRY